MHLLATILFSAVAAFPAADNNPSSVRYDASYDDLKATVGLPAANQLGQYQALTYNKQVRYHQAYANLLLSDA